MFPFFYLSFELQLKIIESLDYSTFLTCSKMFEFNKAVNIVTFKKFPFKLLPLFIQVMIVDQLDDSTYISVENMEEMCFQNVCNIINQRIFSFIEGPIEQIDFALTKPVKRNRLYRDFSGCIIFEFLNKQCLLRTLEVLQNVLIEKRIQIDNVNIYEFV